ncbi:MAG TPA: cation:proton antiporter [Candidatus Krumholzibacteria bacterium]|nr:cation:proton antiporter [Candidatus Krumholzibacteria bacterium]HRX51948.1 cation:proton antiporter [Candidatus Krumholzibacteria bacterium]
MPLDLVTLSGLLAFGLIALAALRVGGAFTRIRMPLITGFLITGALAGPSVLGMIPAEAVARLRLVDQVALAFIGFAAGGELHLRELRGRARAIVLTTAGQTAAIFLLGTAAAAHLFRGVPAIAELGDAARWSAAGLAGAILVARSPSSAIAIVRELRARGPFTRMILGVTVITDAVVIVVFATAAAMADAVLTGAALDLASLLLLVVDLALSVGIGWSVGRLIALLLGRRIPAPLQTLMLLVIGALVFRFSAAFHHLSAHHLGREMLLEPLLMCMVAGVTVANFTARRLEFETLLHGAGPLVYVVFFTLTGASLDLHVLAQGVTIALGLAAVRLAAIALGSWAGGAVAGAPAQHNRLAWAGYVTQAGVGLGLAKEVAAEFPAWGDTFASLLVGVIVLNQFLGPPLMKWALRRVGEAHPQADEPDFDGIRDVLIFGLDSQALALARQLAAHGWNVRIASRRADAEAFCEGTDGVDVVRIDDLDAACLTGLEAAKFEAVVCLLSDEENLRICTLIYEEVGIRNMVVHLHDRANADAFRALGAVPVEPATAFVGLLDHMVRAPAAASLILGLDDDQDVEEIEVRDPLLHGAALRDLELPADVLVLSVTRDQRQVVSHGYTRLRTGDHLTVLGDPDSLEDLRRRLEG